MEVIKVNGIRYAVESFRTELMSPLEKVSSLKV